MDIKEAFNKCSTVLSEDEIKKLVRKYGMEDERKRKLLVVPFFWIMLLSAIKSNPPISLSNGYTFLLR